MDNGERNHYRFETGKDEAEFSSYLVKMSLAIIAASWVVSTAYSPNWSILLAMFFSVVFDVLYALRLGLRLKHMHVILDATINKLDAYEDFGIERTSWGGMSESIFKWNYLPISLSVIFFLIGSGVALFCGE